MNSRLTRARTMLAKRLSRCGVAVSGGALAAALAQNSASANVPASAMAATVTAISAVAVGSVVAPGIVSSQVSALTEGVIKAMFVNKLKTITAIAVIIATISVGGGVYQQQRVAAGEPQPPVAPAGLTEQPEQKEGQSDRPATAADFAGSWNTTYGPMELRRDRNKLSGSYEMGGQHCTIEGKVARRRFTFTYEEPGAQGEGWFELSNDGKSFAGKWRVNGQEQWNDWTGTRAATTDFSGSWETTYGPMKLQEKKHTVTGSYDMGGQNCTIEGTIEGRRLVFKYVEPGVRGEGWFEMSGDGQSFAGEWRAEGNEQWNKWEGKRVKLEVKFEGTWKTTYGPMTLSQDGNKVFGVYEFANQRCPILGKIENGRLEFVYSEPSTYGEGWFELSKDGRSFSGKWREKNASDWSDWTGERTDSGSSKPLKFEGLHRNRDVKRP